MRKWQNYKCDIWKLSTLHKGFFPYTKLLCCGVNVDSYGRNKLHNLIINSPIAEHPAGIKELVDKGINVNAQDINGWSALHFAVQEQSYTAVKALLENGADTDLLESNGNSALHKAVFYSNNNNDIISLLLVYGANPDTVNSHGVTPRSLAQVVENSSIVALFNKCNITKN